MHEFEKYITDIPNFPIEGVTFKDVSPLLKHKFSELVDALDELIDWGDAKFIGGMESRGFILAAALATKKNLGFIPIRKKGKLPPPVISQTYGLEYGQDTLEIHKSDEAGPIVLLDDVLATGGTFKATMTLCEKAGYQIQDMAVLINLSFLNSFKDDGIPVKSILTY